MGSKKRKGPGFRLSVFQRGRAGFGVVDFGLAGVEVFPQVEEFAAVLGRPPLIPLLGDLPQHGEALGVQVAVGEPP